MGWIESDNESVRLIAADALGRTDSFWAINELVDALDDPFLLNRQFTGKSIETMCNVRLEDYGYRFYMSAEERNQPIRKIRSALLEMQASAPLSSPTDKKIEAGTD